LGVGICRWIGSIGFGSTVGFLGKFPFNYQKGGRSAQGRVLHDHIKLVRKAIECIIKSQGSTRDVARGFVSGGHDKRILIGSVLHDVPIASVHVDIRSADLLSGTIFFIHVAELELVFD
jgi:hypothetical protein